MAEDPQQLGGDDTPWWDSCNFCETYDCNNDCPGAKEYIASYEAFLAEHDEHCQCDFCTKPCECDWCLKEYGSQ